MKKLLIATNILFIAVIIWLLLHKGTSNTVSPIAKNDSTIKMTPCVNCDTETEGQTFTHFKNVVQNYRVQHWDVINSLNANFGLDTKNKDYKDLLPLYDHTDARAIWFPLETVKKFICTIEKYNNKLNKPNKELGIRFYYAVYGKDYEIEAKRNRHTLFMVPTYQATPDSPQVDFDPRETYNLQLSSPRRNTRMLDYVTIGKADSIQNSPWRMTKLLMLGGDDGVVSAAKSSPTSVTSSPSASSSPNLIQNTGEMCPANCPVITTLSVIDQH